MPGRGLAVFARWIVVGLIIAAAMLATVGFVDSQGTDEGAAQVRVAAQPLSNGSIEFAVVYDGERILPRGRYLSVAAAPRDRWLISTPVEITSPLGTVETTGALSESPDGGSVPTGAWATPGFGTVPIRLQVAAKVDLEATVEFGIVHNGVTLLPDLRFLDSELQFASHGQWLISSVVEIDFGATPAELVRRFSAHANYSSYPDTLVDVAQACELAEAAPFADTAHEVQHDYDASPSAYVAPEGYPTFRWYVTSSDFSRSDSFDGVWLYRNDSQSASSRSKPASGYLFIVRDVRPPDGAFWWVARFECGDGGSGTDQSVQTGGGDGQLGPAP